MQLFAFLLGAVVAVYGAVQTVRARHPIHSALYLVLNFVALAYLFLLLQAPFLAMVQVAVYAGAIMVLFLFIIMYMNLRELPDRNINPKQRERGQFAAGLLGIAVLLSAFPSFQYLSVDAKAVVDARVASVGARLLQEYAFPFEVASALLLVAMVGVIVVAKQTAQTPKPKEEDQ